MSRVGSFLQDLPVSSRLSYVNANRIAELFYSRIMDAHKTGGRIELDNCLVFCFCHLSTTVNLSICNNWMRFFEGIYLIPKRSSLNADLLRYINNPARIIKSRGRAEFHETIGEIESITARSDLPVILFDIGGYFAPYISYLSERLGDRLLLVLEDTANGHVKYAEVGYSSSRRFKSVAYDSYKMAENVMVANVILGHLHSFVAGWSPDKPALVIGYGRIGRSLCFGLRSRGVKDVVVVDADKARLFMASIEGFETKTLKQLEGVLDQYEYCFSMSGQKGMTKEVLSALRDNSYIFVVTSYDDEFDESVKRLFECGGKGCFDWGGKNFSVVNGGRPINLSEHAAFDVRNLSLHFIFGRIFSIFLSSLGLPLSPDWEEDIYSEMIAEMQFP